MKIDKAAGLKELRAAQRDMIRKGAFLTGDGGSVFVNKPAPPLPDLKPIADCMDALRKQIDAVREKIRRERV